MTNIRYMFANCTSLETVKLIFETTAPKLTNAVALFQGCSNLKNINLDSADLSHITSMSSFCLDCASLEEVDFSNINASAATNY